MSRRRNIMRGEGPRQPGFYKPFAPTDIPDLVAWWDGEGPFSSINDPQWVDPTDFSTGSWTLTGLTAVPGGAGPAGVLDANTLTNTAAVVRHGAQQTIGVSDGFTAITVSAKAGTGRYLVIGNTTSIYRVFDLQTGTLGTSANAGTSTITDLGNGWYDCYMEMQSTTALFGFFISEANSFTAYAGTGVNIQVANPRIVRRNIQQWDPIYARFGNYRAYQPTASARPSMFASPNHTRVKFDGTQQYFGMGVFPNDYTFLNGNSAAGCTTMTVIGVQAVGTLKALWDNSDDDHTVPPVSSGTSLLLTAAGRVLFGLSNGPVNIVSQQSTTVFTANNKVCIITRAGQSQTPQYSLRCNAIEDSGSFSAASSGADPLYGMTMGVRAGLTGLWDNTSRFHFSCYDRYLTDAEVLRLEQYSRNRWGIPT